MPAARVCSEPGCPVLVTSAGRCDDHRRAADRARGTTTERGYGHSHQRARARAIRDASPATPCARCHQPLGPDYRRAHLDHTADRLGYLGLSCPDCNLRARKGGG